MAKTKHHCFVSFEIDLVHDEESMDISEIKPNIKEWLEQEFQYSFDKFKIKNINFKSEKV